MMSAQVHCRGISRRGRKLTDRQVLLMQLVSDGMSDPEIANQLLVSKHTVTMALMRLREKLGGLRTRTQLGVEHVRRNGNREIAC